MTDLDLNDAVLEALLDIPTIKQMERRTEALARKAAEAGKTFGYVKRCSRFERCGRLHCSICRRRAQLIWIAACLLMPAATLQVESDGEQK